MSHIGIKLLKVQESSTRNHCVIGGRLCEGCLEGIFFGERGKIYCPENGQKKRGRLLPPRESNVTHVLHSEYESLVKEIVNNTKVLLL